MSKCRLRSARPKALWGEAAIIAGATLGAAGISGGFTMRAASQQAKATEQAAKNQADAITRAAEANTEALQKTNEVSRELYDKQSELSKEQHNDEMQAQRDLQLSILALGGNEASNAAKKEANALLKRGGRVKLRNARGIEITDGGYALPVEETDTGMLYELRGDNHEQSHKVGNTRKTGVGVRVGNRVVEGEGNGNSSTGELVLTTPDGAIFLSKHTINGFNPREAVLRGMHPMVAYQLQETMKRNRNEKSNRTEFSKGGKVSSCRHKAEDGYWTNYGGSTVAGLGNLAGAALGGTLGWFAGRKLARAQRRAGDMLNNAYMTAGNMMADAYSRLEGIDPNSISYDDYRAEGYIPNLRTPHYNISDRVNVVNRGTTAVNNAIGESNLSGVAKLNRLRDVRARSNEQLNALYAQQENEEGKIEGQNIDARNQAAATNAYLQTRAKQSMANDRFNVLKYNADIANQRILGAAGARSNALTQGTGALASGLLGAADARAEALTNMGTLFGNALSSTGNIFGTRINEINDRPFALRAILGNLNDGQYVDRYGNIITMNQNNNNTSGTTIGSEETNQNNSELPPYYLRRHISRPFIYSWN